MKTWSCSSRYSECRSHHRSSDGRSWPFEDLGKRTRPGLCEESCRS
jgi:hypothetical protein